MLRFFRPGRRKKATLPEGLRIYAVGDVHGRADLLANVFARIDADLSRRPARQPVHVMLGDYVDRGPDSRGVLGLISDRAKSHDVVALMGNHESIMRQFLTEPPMLRHWKFIGGLETLISYGLAPSANPDADEEVALSRQLNALLPDDQRALLAGLRLTHTAGDFFFVHAGVRPRVALNAQAQEDLLWIRDEFLLYENDFGKVIVHGHTPTKTPEFRHNRINIDTGAYATGVLTCLILEGDEVATL